jgi:VIT1/CCC1 family predicted Fe2+/Mn2+ transporter
MDRESALRMMYRKELLHKDAFDAFARIEKNPKIRNLLVELTKEEVGHSQKYLSFVKGQKAAGYSAVDLNILLLSRRILGLGLTMKIMEREEHQLEDKIERHGKGISLPRIDEKRENSLKAEILGLNKVLGNIRDIFFGMSDGLVEIVAAVSGIGAALQSPLLVIVAGSIVAISGTLSMAGGAYLSTDYENIIGQSQNSKYKISSPSKSAAYVGIAYILGSMFPLLPFALGMSGIPAIAGAIVLTLAVLIITATLLSIVSDTPILKRVSKTVLITLGITAITIVLGFLARYYLHLAL